MCLNLASSAKHRNLTATPYKISFGGTERQIQLSNACGQGGVSYTSSPVHTSCPRRFQCTVDPDLALTAVQGSTWPDSPPPLECRPRTSAEPFTGHFDINEKDVVTDKGTTVQSGSGRTDVEGCCYW